jgi:hypothetical protein
MMNGKATGNLSATAANALNTIKGAGSIFGIFAACVILADICVRIRVRAVQGARADQLKYGKGVKEEVDIRNVFMGKCWQLPYCRKFVRERCPIYHAKRTCWKERVGCMCEEEVIRNAMANKTIPKDPVAAVNFIPYNNKLPMVAKMQRCKQCVIYNEHLKHKYKFVLPVVLTTYIAIVAVFFDQLMGVMGAIITKVDRIVGIATYRAPGARDAAVATPYAFQVTMLVCVSVIILAYTIRLIEYLVFKAKL